MNPLSLSSYNSFPLPVVPYSELEQPDDNIKDRLTEFKDILHLDMYPFGPVLIGGTVATEIIRLTPAFTQDPSLVYLAYLVEGGFIYLGFLGIHFINSTRK